MAAKALKHVPMTAGPCGKKCKAPVERILTPPNINLRQGKSHRSVDRHGSETTQHWDGRQDVTVRPDPVKTGLHINPLGG